MAIRSKWGVQFTDPSSAHILTRSRLLGTYSAAPSFEAPTPHSIAFVSAPLRRPAYNFLAVVTQGETGADFLEKNICKTGRHDRRCQELLRRNGPAPAWRAVAGSQTPALPFLMRC